MQNTRDIDALAVALLDLVGFLNSPQRDDALLRAAAVSIDRALFPLLVRLDLHGALAVVDLADRVGRDHTTVSRQLAKLEDIRLVERCSLDGDRRRRGARLTPDGTSMAQAITQARRRALAHALAGWDPADRKAFSKLTRRFVDDLAILPMIR